MTGEGLSKNELLGTWFYVLLLLTNILIVNRFGEKQLLNALNVNVIAGTKIHLDELVVIFKNSAAKTSNATKWTNTTTFNINISLLTISNINLAE